MNDLFVVPLRVANDEDLWLAQFYVKKVDNCIVEKNDSIQRRAGLVIEIVAGGTGAQWQVQANAATSWPSSSSPRMIRVYLATGRVLCCRQIYLPCTPA